MYAYGLSITSLPERVVHPTVSRHTWHDLVLHQERKPLAADTHILVDDDSADLRVSGVVTLSMTRSPLGVVVGAPTPFSAASLTHPLLTFAAAVAARWHGRSAFHGAAVVVDGAAWVLLGEAGSGKTTLSSQLDLAGFEVLTDDLSIIAGADVLTGPRSADLRPTSAAHLGRGEEIVEPLGRSRWRWELGPAPLEAPLGGFIELQWADALVTSVVPLAERIQTLFGHEALSLGPSGHRGFLDLLPVPMWRLSRPSDWSFSEATVAAVLQVARAAR